MLRVSATTLETYRLFIMAERFDFERLKADWSGEREFDPIMVRGTSFHDLLENWHKDSSKGEIVESHGWQWHTDQLRPIAENEQLNGVAEVKGTADITLPNGEIITLVGKVDRLDSFSATEYKTTANFSTDKYTESLQWQVYCLIFDLQSVTYKVAYVDNNNPVNIKAFETLTMNAYPALTANVMWWVTELVSFCREHGFYKQIGTTLEAEKQRIN